MQALFPLVARLYDTRGRGAAKVVDRNDRLVLTLDPCGAVVGIITTYALWLYGYSIYYYRAHELIDPWSRESSPKKSKLSLIRR